MQQAELHIVPYRGIKFSWHNGQACENMIMKKLDWVLGNTTFAKDWPDAYAHFLPRDVSDHSSMVIHLSEDHFHPRPTFRFLNLWLDREDFMPQLARVWEQPVHGSPFFKLTTKLQMVKVSLKNWHKHNRTHITSRVSKAKRDWAAAQEKLDGDPYSEEASAVER
ncbi:hypothetical protein OIU84_027257 [Salix udensis]|uniref:Endonuclease/exonuclease/phosphatase n=1 Tax=Salix udensis TaxID=889485 RepID=A0AAD6PA70_9ROSI|nr:hypothetical protein OIU84_027257 [Salix udensis]